MIMDKPVSEALAGRLPVLFDLDAIFDAAAV
jgi:hypothetical protein